MATATTVRGPRQSTKKSFVTKLRYRFDNAMSRGPLVVIAYLGIVSLAVMVLTAIIAVIGQLTFAGGNARTFPEELWQALLRTLDSGSFASDTAWPTRILALIVTLAGIFVAGSLIGLIANAVDQKVEELRRGRSPVVESGHSLILGWSDQVPRIVSELVTANESEKYASVVVLAAAEKREMEETLKERVPEHKTTRIVCRSGSPSSPEDLERVAVQDARSVVVVRDSDGDAGVVKAILALRTFDGNVPHVVAELSEADNTLIVRAVTGGRVLTVSSDDVVAEVTAQACLQAGLSAVFADLLDFDGDEIYFTSVPELSGHTYRDALLGFERCSVIGRMVHGEVELNPPPDTVLGADDELILVAADDSAIRFTGVADAIAPIAPGRTPQTRGATHVALVGWSQFGAKVLKELDEFLPPGSRVDVVVDRDLVDPGRLAGITMEHAVVQVRAGDGGPDDLRQLRANGDPQQIVVLGYRDALSVDDADARTLLTLLGLRTVWPADGAHEVRIVAELLDQRNLALAVPVGVDDLIVSNALSSLLMAQLSERAELLAVFDDLFDAEGAAIEMRAADALVGPEPVPFATVVAAAAAVGASAFGYRLDATGAVVLNPSKSSVVTLGPADTVVLVSHTDR
jgi:Trk K+ transport system NAD-binding subunit